MNYTIGREISVSIKILGLDINGNRVKQFDFFERKGNGLNFIKSEKTNENIDNLTNNDIIRIWF